MGERIRAFDWASHPLGDPAHWPAALKMAVSLCLNSNFPTAIYWGADMHVLYNDAWSVIPAERHPAALGRKGRELWSDIWAEVGPQFEAVYERGEGFAGFEVMLPMVRGGEPRETWWNYSITPIRHEDNTVGGIFNQGNEVTGVVLARRAREAELQRWQATFLQAPAGIALLRGPTHVFEVVNESYARLVGGRSLIGKTVSEALPEVTAQGYVDLLDRVWRSGEPYIGRNVVVQLQAEDGRNADHTLDFIYQPMRDAQGAVDGIFVLVTDVTERARAEAALRLSNWQLGEERARLAVTVEAEQRAQSALKRFNETLEAHVRQRTEQLAAALAEKEAILARLRGG